MSQPGEIKKLRVAAYCRVSTELEQQQSSYDIQIEYYTRHIMQNPNWIFAVSSQTMDARDQYLSQGRF